MKRAVNYSLIIITFFYMLVAITGSVASDGCPTTKAGAGLLGRLKGQGDVAGGTQAGVQHGRRLVARRAQARQQ